jgi:hypothetical protein
MRIKGMPKLFYPRLKARVFGEALGKSNRRVLRSLRGRHVVSVKAQNQSRVASGAGQRDSLAMQNYPWRQDAGSMYAAVSTTSPE